MQGSKKILKFQPSKESELKGKTIVFRNAIDPISTVLDWDYGLGTDIVVGMDEIRYELHAPDSTLIFEALDPEKLQPKPKFYRSASIGGNNSSLSLVAKELHIGSGQYNYSDYFSQFDGSNLDKDVTRPFLVLSKMNDAISQSEIRANTFIHKDGALAVEGHRENDRFTIDGDLSVLSGGMRVSVGSVFGAIMPMTQKMNRPSLEITGKALIRDAKIVTYITNHSVYGKWKVLSANGGVTLEGSQVMGVLAYNLGDYASSVDTNTTTAIDNTRIYKDDRNLYEHSLKVENGGKVLYAIPSLKNKLKDIPTLDFVGQAKNKLVEAFITELDGNIQWCSPINCSFLQGYKDTRDILQKYLNDKNVTSGAGIALTGFQAIDKKLKLLENSQYAQIVEELKNKDDLWAVELTGAFFQPKDNALELEDYLKQILTTGILPDPSNPNFSESPSNKHPLPPTTQTSRMIQENLGARLSITQRLSTYAFSKQGASRINLQSPKEQEIQESKNKNQTELASTSTSATATSSAPSTSSSIQEINSTNLLSNLWFNLLGGANINGNKAGGSFGANVGYDKALENIVLGGYLSYGYLHSQDASSKDLTYSANSHAIEAGMYLRSDFSSHQIDFIFKSQIGISEITDTTETIDKLTSNHVSSFTQASLSYGYDFSTALIDVKPYVGISAGFAYISKPTGIFSHLDSQSNFSLGASIGLELKKYFSNNGFFYIIPSIEQGMLDTQQDIKIANSSNSLPIDSSLKTYAQILIGGEIELSSSWSLGVSLGVKQNIAGNKDEQGKWKNETYLMGNIGGVWRF